MPPSPLKMKKIKSTGEIRFYKYWHCSHKSTQIKCSQKSITEDALEKALNELIADIEMSDDFIKWSMLYLHYVLDNESEDRNLITNNIENQRKEVMTHAAELARNLVEKFNKAEPEEKRNHDNKRPKGLY